MGLENTLDYLNAQECREISSHDAGMEKFDKLAHSAMTNKILSDIIYQVFLYVNSFFKIFLNNFYLM